MLRVTDKQYWMHPTLKTNLDTIAYNAANDFSFLIIITGDGKVRSGKTFLGTQIGYYLAGKRKQQFINQNLFFSSADLMDKAKKLSPAVFVLDESRSDLAAAKTIFFKTQDILDFFNESGKLNNIVILILPDFFDLTKTLAVSHSECLINCFVQKNRVVKDDEGNEVLNYDRGKFAYFGNQKKNLLYIMGSKEHNHWACKPDFYGDFPNFFTLDKIEYEKQKDEFVFRERSIHENPMNKYIGQRNLLIQHLCETYGYTHESISKLLSENGFPILRQSITAIMANSKKQKENI